MVRNNASNGHADEIPQAEIWLKEIALLAHQGNRAAALDRLAVVFPVLFPDTKGNGRKDIRGPSRNGHSDPMTLAIAELDLGHDLYRIAGALEQWLGVVYVEQLQKYTEQDLLEIPNFGRASIAKLRAALRKVLKNEAGKEEVLHD